MKRERGVFIYVAPEFRTQLKLESAKANCSVVDLTRKLARIKCEDENKDERKFTFRL